MTEKQKKLNRLSDMRGLAARKSDAEWQSLMEKRLLHRGFALQKSTEKKESWKDRKASVSDKQKSEEVPLEIGVKKPLILRPAENNLLPKFWPGMPRPVFRFSAKNSSPVIVFVAIALVLMSTFPILQAAERNRLTGSAVLGAATTAYDELAAARLALLSYDFESADGSLKSAFSKLASAAEGMRSLSAFVSFLPQFESGEDLVTAASEAVLGLQYLNLGLNGFMQVEIGQDGIRTTDLDAAELLTQSQANLKIGADYLASASGRLESVDLGALPQDIVEEVEQSRELLQSLRGGIAVLGSFEDLLLGLLADGPQKYLVLFQNNRELRPTGGFIGTVGLLELDGGKIRSFKIETVYNPDGQLKVHVAPPGPLTYLLTDRWGLRDSNWFFDFPTSARKASEFYAKETGQQVQGVLAFTTNVFPKLLTLTGPIEMPEYKVTLTSENFVDMVQYQTSVIYDRELNQPKKFLADFTPLLLERLGQLDDTRRIDFLETVIGALTKRDLQFFSFDESMQARLRDFGWDGGVRAAPDDYLAVVSSSVGAGKTDQDIEQNLDLSVKILPDGKTRNRLTLSRSHHPGSEKDFPTNVSFLRVYVPEGSRLVSSSGFDNLPFMPASLPGAIEDQDLSTLDSLTRIDALSNTLIYEESGKTVFANWVTLAPGESRELVLEYETPIVYNLLGVEAELYTLLVQKQAGAKAGEIKVRLELGPGFTTPWTYPQEAFLEENSIVLKKYVETDLIFGAVLKTSPR